MADDLVSRRVIFRGRVQGVGFRMTAAHIARQFPVGGTVRNCSDGTVQLVAIGAAHDVGKFLDALRHAMRGNISGEEIADAPAAQRPPRFEIID